MRPNKALQLTWPPLIPTETLYKPSTQYEAISEVFRGPPVSVLDAVFVFGLGLLLMVVPFISRG